LPAAWAFIGAGVVIGWVSLIALSLLMGRGDDVSD
jgi:hypothetical protein